MRPIWLVPSALLIVLSACAGRGSKDDLTPPISSSADWIRDESVILMDLTQGDPLAYSTRARKAVQPLSKKVRKCYKEALKSSPRLYGQMEVALEIDEAGVVQRTYVKYSDIPDFDLEGCILPLYADTSFPVPTMGPQVVTYPYVFTSKNTPREIKQALERLHNLVDPDTFDAASNREADEFSSPW